jgi:uncharacterized membrane-anchored protein
MRTICSTATRTHGSHIPVVAPPVRTQLQLAVFFNLHLRAQLYLPTLYLVPVVAVEVVRTCTCSYQLLMDVVVRTFHLLYLLSLISRQLLLLDRDGRPTIKI